jgi:wyosine [tRNA(Phe)-imidazoG37] synthetase (radical SAM superfamily)
MSIVYGPVPSWRLGKSLGIDPISTGGKTCSFDCIYCQIGRTKKKILTQANFISIEKMKAELKSVLAKTSPDVITFSGMGEPTLAKNLASAIDTVREITSLPLTILTNSSLMSLKEIRIDLAKLDWVIAKIDAPNQDLFEKINRPMTGINFKDILAGIKQFRKEFRGKLSLQMMFVDENKSQAKAMAAIAKSIQADEIQLNTPLRESPVKPLSVEEMEIIEEEFKGLNSVSVYKSERPKVQPISKKEELKRRGKFIE